MTRNEIAQNDFLLGIFIGFIAGIILIYAAHFNFSNGMFAWHDPDAQLAQASVLNTGSLPQYPIRNLQVEKPTPQVSAGIVYYPQKNKILWSSNQDTVLPIASLTKLVTAAVTIDTLPLNKTLTVSPQALATEGTSPDFFSGEKIRVKNLLKALLIESSNDAAAVLAEEIGKQKFRRLMNSKAKTWGLGNTHFEEPTGLSADNVSTAREMSVLTRKVTETYPLIRQITSRGSHAFISVSGRYHQVSTTNQVLNNPFVHAGKTGYTEAAGENLTLLTSTPAGQKLVIVVLGARDRFEAALKLLDWANSAYTWNR